MKILALVSIAWFVGAGSAQSEVLKFCYDPYPPYTFGSEGIATEGLKIELLDAVVDRIEGVSATVTLLPWKRCQSETRAGKFDGILPLFPNDDRKSYMDFSIGTFDEQSVLWHRTGQFSEGFDWSGDFSELAGLTLGMLTGSYIDEEMEAAFETGKGITRTRDVTTLMKLLVAGRVDLVATDAAVGRHILSVNGWLDRAERLAQPIASRTSHFGLSKASGASVHIAAFDDVITQLAEEGVITQILNGGQ